jgi:single-stranded DNA-binding protein
MRCDNYWYGQGVLLKAIDLKESTSGVPIGTTTLMVDVSTRRRKSQEAIPLVIWNDEARRLSSILKPGSKVTVTGTLRMNPYPAIHVDELKINQF